LSTALLLFNRADGERYLLEKSNIIPSDWSEFMIKLYSSIMNGKYRVDGIGFKAPLSRVQLLKMKKELDKNENIFIEEIEGINLSIDL